jgi:hypothetical protein
MALSAFAAVLMRVTTMSHGTFPSSSAAVGVQTVDMPLVLGVKYSPVDVAAISTVVLSS